MKQLIRKLTWNKLDKSLFEGISKHYLVVYRNDYALLSEIELEQLLLHPKKDKDIKFIFNWEDKLVINTEFKEIED